MSSPRNDAASNAYNAYSNLSTETYGVGIPAMKSRLGEINSQLGAGEPAYLKSAFGAQRTGLAEGLSAQGGVAQAQQTRASEGATRGGNAFSSLHPQQIGSALANALYGSRFAEGQGNIDQSMNLMSMAMGGAGQAGNSALGAAGNQLGAIGYLPNYNQTYANILGAANIGGSIYGAFNQPRPLVTGASLGGTANVEY